MTWLSDFMDATIEAESPRSYFWWSGLAAISAVTNNKIWVDKYIYKLNPNLFVFLVGSSGLVKSAPVAIARRIVEESEEVKVISGRASIQKIVHELGQVWTLESKKILAESTAFICSSEFASSLVADDDSLTILTDLHDTHYHTGTWRNLLKSGSDILKHPCLSILSATNEVHFDSKIDQRSMMGGFIARTILVVETKRSRINALLDPPEVEFNPSKFVPYLQEIAKLKGPFTITTKAKEVFKTWYHDYRSRDIEDPTGTASRMYDRVMKVAMNLSLAAEPVLILREANAIEAIDVCLNGVTEANKATVRSGKKELAEKAGKLIELLVVAENCEMRRKKVLEKGWGHFDHIDLDRIVETLEQAGLMESENRGGILFYRLTSVAINHYLKEKKE